MSEKLILTENFGEYKGHILGNLKIGCVVPMFFNVYDKSFLCETLKANEIKHKIDLEIEFLNIDKLNKEISNINCNKCIETYYAILDLIEKEKELSATQKLLIAVGSHIFNVNMAKHKITQLNSEVLDDFKKHTEKTHTREERLKNKLIKTKKNEQIK
jgi:hypothetical protein